MIPAAKAATSCLLARTLDTALPITVNAVDRQTNTITIAATWAAADVATAVIDGTSVSFTAVGSDVTAIAT